MIRRWLPSSELVSDNAAKLNPPEPNPDCCTNDSTDAVGRCHTDRSGFWGPWNFSPTTFSNLYFVELTTKKWSKKSKHEGGKWTGPTQYEDPTGKIMMLPTDMALLWDGKFKKYVLEYAKDEEKFFRDFASAFGRLLELGVQFPETKAAAA